MSDDEYYSDNNSLSDDSDNDDIHKKKPIKFRPKSSNIQIDDAENDSDLESEDNISDDETSDIEEDEQMGGANEEDIEQTNDADSDPEDSEDEDSDNDIELNENGEEIINSKPSTKKGKDTKSAKNKSTPKIIIDNEDDDEDDDYDDNYMQKFDAEITKNYINEFHPECFIQNYDEIAKLAVVVRNSDNVIIDPNHRTIPFLTKYEKARILGQRAKQIESGARPFIKISENIVDSYIIAELELREKKIPFIIRRPLPNGTCEYWHLRDLEVVGF
jgi:DNA-directed RNA polymerase I, II, and III subunit RPABC2